MWRKVASVILLGLGVVAAVGWAFVEKPHYEAAQSGLGKDMADKGSILWQPEAGFPVHVVLTQVLAVGLGLAGVILLAKAERGGTP